MSANSLARAVGTSHPAARDPQTQQKPRLLLFTGAPEFSPLSGNALFNGDDGQGHVIETERLVLRPLSPEDFDAYFAMFTDPGAAAMAGRGPLTSDEAWTRLLRQAGHWQLLGYGQFAVFEKASGSFVGEVGFGDFRRHIGVEFESAPEASWIIIQEARGNGYATEAIAAAVDWMERNRGTSSTVCMIHARNRSSQRIAQKLGFKPFRYTEYRGFPAIFYRRNAPGRSL